MPQFSATSQERLDSCHADLQTVFEEVVRWFDCSVLCGHRNQTAQMIAYEAGKSQLKWPGSKHNKTPSLAIDVAPYPIDWQDKERFYLFAGYVIATANQLFLAGKISHRIRWGGDWDGDTQVNDQKFNDLPHFELIRVE